MHFVLLCKIHFYKYAQEVPKFYAKIQSHQKIAAPQIHYSWATRRRDMRLWLNQFSKLRVVSQA